jgi:hypothetical protein
MTPDQLKTLCSRFPFTPVVAKPGRILTCPVRLRWPQLGELATHPQYKDSKPQASATLIIPLGADMLPLEKMGREVAFAHFGPILNKEIVTRQGGEDVKSTIAKELLFPWRRQTKYQGKPGFSADGAGYFMRTSSLFLPRLLDHKRNQVLGNDPAIYPGCWVIALLDLRGSPDRSKAAADDAKRGVRATLVQLMKIADDEVLPDSESNSDDAFAGIEAPADMLSHNGNAAAAALAGGADVAW